MRNRVLAAGIVLFVGACGSSQPNLGEYADSVDGLVATMNAQLDTSLAEYRSGALTAGRVAAYLEERVEVRAEFLGGFNELDVPDPAKELSDATNQIVGALRDAEADLAALARGLDPGADERLVWQTDESAVLDAADAQAIALCRSAREAFNAPNRDAFAGLYWVPPELQQVVEVAFQCTLEERGGG